MAQLIYYVKSCFASSQVFTGLHVKVNYFRFSQKMTRCDEVWRDVKSCVNSSRIYRVIYQCIMIYLWRVKSFFESLCRKENTSKHPNTSYFHYKFHKYNWLYAWRGISTLHNDFIRIIKWYEEIWSVSASLHKLNKQKLSLIIIKYEVLGCLCKKTFSPRGKNKNLTRKKRNGGLVGVKACFRGSKKAV